MNKEGVKGLGTFEGVYTPTILTILGVILYLRLGWVVGNAGLVGAIIIILMAHVITICTALSMSSMLTNINIGAGGAYTIISRSLGLEAGGAVGIPFYIAQTLSIAFYIIGFSELWINMFPSHSIRLVGFIVWLLLSVLSVVSTRLALRVQFFVLGAIGLSIISFLLGPSHNSNGPILLGSFEQAGFWATFAIFFPAATGILAGASMSGDLKDPRKSIIWGTLAAIITGLVVYLIVAYWFAKQAPADLLLANSSIILDLSLFKPLIIAGILGATLSSALSTMVGAPRILAALAENRTIPLARVLASKTPNNEPRNAILVSSAIALIVIMVGNLDSLATMLTMFFLATYGAINLIVFIEKTLGIASFRPQFDLALVIPIVGFCGCLGAMLLINKLFTLLAILVIVLIYSRLASKNLVSPWGDVRGGVFTAITERAAQKAMSMPYHPRLWKPSIIVPVENPLNYRNVMHLTRDIVYPSGRLYCLSVYTENNGLSQLESKRELLAPLIAEELFVQDISITDGSFDSALPVVLQTLKSSFLPPNAVLLTISNNREKQKRLLSLIEKINSFQIGLMCLHIHPKTGFGQEKKINLWLRDRSPNINLAVLTAFQLMQNWDQANLNLLRVVKNREDIEKAVLNLEFFKEKARLPVNTAVRVIQGDFYEVIQQETADITIFGMPVPCNTMFDLIGKVPSTVIFLADSGLENAIV